MCGVWFWVVWVEWGLGWYVGGVVFRVGVAFSLVVLWVFGDFGWVSWVLWARWVGVI